MPKTFHQKAVEIIKRIPMGRVATYGMIAAMAGSPRASRQVVRVLTTSSKKENLPWHRVVNSKGMISLKRGLGYEEQKILLENEGIEFKQDDRIDLVKYLWKPHIRK